MIEFFYTIEFNAVATGETTGWKDLSEDAEYTKAEVDKEIRRLRRLNTPYKFRKRFLYAAEVQTATVRGTPPILSNSTH